jgi:hypothetical protein
MCHGNDPKWIEAPRHGIVQAMGREENSVSLLESLPRGASQMESIGARLLGAHRCKTCAALQGNALDAVNGTV